MVAIVKNDFHESHSTYQCAGQPYIYIYAQVVRKDKLRKRIRRADHPPNHGQEENSSHSPRDSANIPI